MQTGEAVTAAVNLRAPFPWMGGKRRVAPLVWSRFGDVPNYVEPFAGSLAVLLGRPAAHLEQPRIETVNDLDCYVACFWRALQADPEQVAFWADAPVNEADMHARHDWLLGRAEFRERMHHDPDFYDAKIAGWWVWGICQWIGGGWCSEAHYGTPGHQKLPHLGDAGMGVHRPSQQLPHLGDAGRGDLYAYLRALADRLRPVRVCCGDWTRVLGPTPTEKLGITGVLLDPPYLLDERAGGLYGVESDCAHAVREWAIAHGDNPRLRIALCGYEAEGYAMPESWECVPWKAAGGYGSRSQGRGRENCARERVWFNSSCLRPSRGQLGLFAEALR